MEKKTTPRKRPGRSRWSAVVKYLTELMQDQKVKRETRTRAAMRLSEILIAREQKEAAELRAAARKTEAPEPTQTPGSVPDAPEPEPELSAQEAASQFLAKVRAQREAA